MCKNIYESQTRVLEHLQQKENNQTAELQELYARSGAVDIISGGKSWYGEIIHERIGCSVTDGRERSASEHVSQPPFVDF